MANLPGLGQPRLPGTSPLNDPADGALFKNHLGDSINAMAAGKRTVDVSDPSSTVTASAGALLEHAIKAQLDKGTSLEDVVGKLASSLAASVAAALGISPQAAQDRLTQMFTQALKPDGTGPPGTNAERASTLVSRLRLVAGLATGVTNGDPGQSIRLIAGQRSDAVEAKATPPPDPDSILRDALAALASSASPVPGPAVTSAAPVAPAAASDGRTVALDTPVQAIAAGGDTPLGRILTRAVLADQRQTTTPAAAAAAGSHAADAASSTAVLDAFVGAFAAALARSDAAPSAARDGGSSSSAPAADAAPVAASSGTSTGTALSFAIPFVPDATPVAPPAPASTLPQAQHVDANAVVDQMLRGMQVRTADGQSEVRLRLVPEQLGDVSIKLTVTGGVVDASITAHTADAQNALAGGQNQLAKTLADAGLKLQSFTVGLAGGGFADNRDQSRPNDSWNRPGSRRIGGVEAVDSAESDDAQLLASPSFGPPIFSARSLPGALNYLV